MNKSREVTIRSAHDGTSLTISDFRPEYGGADSETFLVTAKVGRWFAEVRASTFMTEDLGTFFRTLAENWTGWDGERSWGSLEGEFSLTATSNHTGHITMKFTLAQPWTGFEWQVAGALELEAGSLDSLAENVSQAWSAHAT